MARQKKLNKRVEASQKNGQKGGRPPDAEAMRRREVIWQYICQYAKQECVCPTFDEIMRGCKISTKSVVNYHVKMLIKEGRIERVGRTRMRIAGSMLVLREEIA